MFVVTVTDAFSQVEGKFRGGLDLGIALRGNPELLGSINFGYNPRDNMNIGTKIGIAERSTLISLSNHSYSYFLGTYTYYFDTKSFMPFVGGGLGVYAVTNFYREYSSNNSYWYIDIDDYINKSNKFGAFLATGIEFGRFKLSAEYNMIPSTKGTFLGRSLRYDPNTGQEVYSSTSKALNIKNSY